MLPIRGTPILIHERSPQTTSVGHRRPRRRLRRHLAPRHDHARRRPLPPEAAIGALDEVLARLLLEDRARRREQRAVGEASVDRLVGAAERRVGQSPVSALRGDGRLDVQRRIEQDGALDAVGVARRELGDELAAVAVAHPRRARDPERLRGLDEVGDVLLDAPRRLPARAAVAAVVDRRSRDGRRAAPRPASGSAGRGRSPRAGRGRAAPPDLPTRSRSAAREHQLAELRARLRAPRAPRQPRRAAAPHRSRAATSRARMPVAAPRSRPGCPSSSRAATTARSRTAARAAPPRCRPWRRTRPRGHRGGGTRATAARSSRPSRPRGRRHLAPSPTRPSRPSA